MKRSYLKHIGKQGKRTARAVQEWKKTIPPNHQGYWVCYICGKWVDYLVAEHVQSKARHPDKRADTTNLRPVCNECNALKGSHDG